MIQAAMKRALDALIKATRFEERKLEQLEEELQRALVAVKNARFKARQDSWAAQRSFFPR